MPAARSTNLSLTALAAEMENLKAQVAKQSSRQAFPTTQANVRRIRQTAHGFTAGTVLRHNGTSWVKSQADSPANAVVAGVVLVSLSADIFILGTPGSYVTGLSGLTAGSIHFLDATTAGALTTTAPTHVKQVLKADTTTSGLILTDGPTISVSTSDPGATSANPGDLWLKY